MLVPQLILCITSGFLMVKFISSSKGRGFGFQKKKKNPYRCLGLIVRRNHPGVDVCL